MTPTKEYIAIPFGKYKGIPIDQINDHMYLKWAYEKLTSLTNIQRTAIHDRYIDLLNLLR